ncbi:MAG: GNAT family N-acetyltransferase [Candidatus Eremiobacteraeota bacterium]|nr:GNAT family N-acetyltransferase [Candidatus Eremiobacteraeota bacterium]
MPRLHVISAERYARDVLPLTASLWAGRRSFDEYVAQTLEIARGAYGRRGYRTVGLYDGQRLVASFKRYERSLHEGSRRLRAIGIGAVFTPPEHRGRGYASVMLAMALDAARAQGYALAFLFSDIAPQFYAALGFQALPSRSFSLRAEELPSARLRLARVTDDDWRVIRRCFDFGEQRRIVGFLRSAFLWEWIRTRIRQDAAHTNLVVRQGKGVSAYVLGARVPERDAYVVDEFGFAGDDAAATIPVLLRAAAGDLRRVIGWLPVDFARKLLPKPTIRRRKRAIFMAAPLHPEGGRVLRAISSPSEDFCWATDHI